MRCGQTRISRRSARRRGERCRLLRGFVHLPHCQQQRGVEDLLRIGGRGAPRRVSGQRLPQVARAIGRQGVGESLLFGRGERKLREVEHGGVVKAPLDDVDGRDADGQERGLAQLGHGLLAALDVDGAVGRSQRGRALDESEKGAPAVLNFEDKFGAANGGGAEGALQTQAGRLFAAEEVKQPAPQIKAGQSGGLCGRQEHEVAQLAEAHGILFADADDDEAVLVSVDALVGLEDLLEAQGLPVGGSHRLEFDAALHVDDHGLKRDGLVG